MEGDSQASIVISQENMSEADKPAGEEVTDPEASKVETPPGKIEVHSLEEVYFMDAEKWPRLELPAGSELSQKDHGRSEKPPCEEYIMDDVSFQSIGELTEREEEEQGWATSAPKRRDGKRKPPAVATRVSSRISKNTGPMLEKATQRRQEKDALIGGKNDCNPFTVLNNVSNSHIHNVMKDLDIEVGDIDTQIEAFRAEEIVRAALAEANYKCYLERINKKDAPQGEEALAELAMEAIDNSCRVQNHDNHKLLLLWPARRRQPVNPIGNKR